MSAKYPKIIFKKGTDAEFAASNPILASGEPGWTTDSKVFKIGDGSTNWNSLAGVTGAGGGINSNPAGIPGASGISNIVQITQAAFNALTSYSANTVYLIVS